MLPMLGGLISGGISVLGNLFGQNQQNKFNEQMQQQNQQFNAAQVDKQMQFNSAEAQLNRDFQEQMSSTAYQRASKDMQSAGLNPMMMFGSGGPSSTPGGSTASGGAATSQPAEKRSALLGLGKNVENMISSAVSLQTFEKMVDEIANLRVMNRKIAADTAVSEEVAPLRQQERLTEAQETRRRASEADKSSSEAHSARLRATKDQAEEAVVENPYGRKLYQGKVIGGYTSGVLEPVGDVLNSARKAFRIRGTDRWGDWR